MNSSLFLGKLAYKPVFCPDGRLMFGLVIPEEKGETKLTVMCSAEFAPEVNPLELGANIYIEGRLESKKEQHGMRAVVSAKKLEVIK